MVDYNKIFWTNVGRWQKFRQYTDKEMALRLGVGHGAYSVSKNTKVGVSTKLLDRYTTALDLQPADLFDEWSDEAWKKFSRESEKSESTGKKS